MQSAGMPDSEKLRAEATGDQLRQKISNEFQTSTFLAGFSATILSIEITFLWQQTYRPGLLPLSIAVLIAAVIIYVAAIVKLDELTMPKRFSEENRNVTTQRLPQKPSLSRKIYGNYKSG